MDHNGDKKLNKEELKYGLKDYGIETSPAELDDIFRFFDRDQSGTIDLDELLIGLKGDLNEKTERSNAHRQGLRVWCRFRPGPLGAKAAAKAC